MKKLFALIISAVVSVAALCGVAGCKKDKGNTYSVYAPDGAPALSLVAAKDNKKAENFNIHVIQADTIQAQVAGENPKADFAIMPVNAAVKILGNGQKYKLLGTVTHGNLFLMKKANGADITQKADLATLVGKTVGVINLANVPGLTFKAILKDNNLEYNELQGAEPDSSKVNLKNVAATDATPANTACEYFVVPEPAASTKQSATGGKLTITGSLQDFYGTGGGYPQAVAVAKATIVKEDEAAVKNFISVLEGATAALQDNSAQYIVDTVKGWLTDGLTPTFNANNLTAQVIKNCGIKYLNNTNGKQAILDYMQKVNSVAAQSFGTPDNSFFY